MSSPTAGIEVENVAAWVLWEARRSSPPPGPTWWRLSQSRARRSARNARSVSLPACATASS